MVFQGPRRHLLEVASRTQPAYSYRKGTHLICICQLMFIIGYARSSGVPTLGSFHGSEITYLFGFTNETDWIATDAISKYHFPRIRLKCPQILSVYFARNRDPNPPADSISLLRNINWPEYSTSAENPPLLSFFDSTVNITSDTYRKDAIKLMIQLLMQWSSCILSLSFLFQSRTILFFSSILTQMRGSVKISLLIGSRFEPGEYFPSVFRVRLHVVECWSMNLKKITYISRKHFKNGPDVFKDFQGFMHYRYHWGGRRCLTTCFQFYDRETVHKTTWFLVLYIPYVLEW